MSAYTELEWALQVQTPAVGAETYEFRVYAGSTALDSYAVTPQLAVAGANQTITLPHIASVAVARVPTVTAVAVRLTLSYIGTSTTLPSPSITVGSRTITLPLVASTTILNPPSTLGGVVGVVLPMIAGAPTLAAPSIAVGPSPIALPLITSTPTLYPPTVITGRTIALPLLTVTPTLFAPTVAGTPSLYKLRYGSATVTAVYLGTTLIDPTKVFVSTPS